MPNAGCEAGMVYRRWRQAQGGGNLTSRDCGAVGRARSRPTRRTASRESSYRANSKAGVKFPKAGVKFPKAGVKFPTGLPKTKEAAKAMIKESGFLLQPKRDAQCILVKATQESLKGQVTKTPLLSHNEFHVFDAADVDVQQLCKKFACTYVVTSCKDYHNAGNVYGNVQSGVHANSYKKYLIRHKPPSGAPNTTIVMYGAPCAGKSSVLKKAFAEIVHEEKSTFVHIDPDEARMFANDYQYCLSGSAFAAQNGKQPNTLWCYEKQGIPPRAGYAEEGKYMAAANAFMRSVNTVRQMVQETIFDWVVANKYNVIYDSTCAADLNFCTRLIPSTNRIYLGVYSSIDSVLERCTPRGQKEGRFVPDAVLRQDYENLYGDDKMKAFNAFEKRLKPGESLYLYNNDDTKIKLIKSVTK